MTLTVPLVIELLLLLLAANGAPVLAARLLGRRWAWPVDLGARFVDGRPLLGRSKTWRGLVAAVAATAALAWLLGYGAVLGAMFGAASMAGDLLASFVKRRLGIEPSGMALGLDQVPEALLPMLVCGAAFGLAPLDMLALVALFAIGELALSRVMFRLGIRERPY
jgi:hypothetical protein